MHKKLASELTSLAHSILQMKNKDNVFLLQKRAHEIYEKLSVLAYVEEYINSTPQAGETKEELLAKIAEVENIIDLKSKLKSKEQEAKNKPTLMELNTERTLAETVKETQQKDNNIIGELDNDEIQMTDFADDIAEDVIEQIEEESIAETILEEITKNPVEEITEQPFDELEELLSGEDDNKKFDETSFIEDKKAPTLEEELKDTISVDVTADLFTKAEPKKSLNDRLQNTIQIGLNDRIAFVKHLFNGDSGDFNRVVSQLNTFDTEKEAKKFITKNVKPEYDWSEKEEYETRFLEIVERRFS